MGYITDHKGRVALALVAVLVFVSLVVGIIEQQDGSSSESAPGGASSGTQNSDGFARDSGGDVGAPATGTGSDGGKAIGGPESVPGAGANADVFGLKVIRTGDMEITVKKGRLESDVQKVALIATGSGGYVVSTSVMEIDPEYGSQALLQLRVPSAKFDDVIKRLGAVGKVTSRTFSGQDVTQEYVDAESRLRHDKAIETRLLAILAKATTVADTLAIQDRLSQVQQQIEIEKGQLNYMDKLTQMATINVSLSEKTDDEAPDERGFGDAWSEAGERFMDTINAAISASGAVLALMLLIALPVVVIWAIWQLFGRRSRHEDSSAAESSSPQDPLSDS